MIIFCQVPEDSLEQLVSQWRTLLLPLLSSVVLVAPHNMLVTVFICLATGRVLVSYLTTKEWRIILYNNVIHKAICILNYELIMS